MKFFASREKKKGFTLYEVLIAGAILALISVALMISVTGYIKSSNDKERLAELQQLQLALRLYKDANGRYPAAGCPDLDPAWEWTSPGPGTDPWYQRCDTGYITGLVPDYLPELPVDPISEYVAHKGFLYMTDPNGMDYKIIVHMSTEATTPANMGEPFSRCPADYVSVCPPIAVDYCIPSNSFSVYTPGAACW